ncbi:hypothetical protein [Streptomyces pinistramenti]|uniref:hypothetical protein n=1 Tax=Streptomyces pinistramenti TaxID=2884812 RepID=UPI001D0899F4|nr:hypothetical protein [Streptomyces pinistramenti]MCB5911845.1 hypothetical protein [Streptomyces pinistramenti]
MVRKAFTTAVAGAALLAAAGSAHAHTPPTGMQRPAHSPAPVSPTADDGWQQVGDGMTAGISGIVIDSVTGDAVDTLGVRDNKKEGENRLVAVGYRPGTAPQVRPVTWSGKQPVDLEALDAIPGHAQEYVALASDGTAYRIRRDGDAAKVLDSFELPGISSKGNYEGFALSAVDGRLLAVWADRGADSDPGVLTAAEWNPDTHDFGKPDSAKLRVPFPTENVRHISDVKIAADGTLTVSSASDPGDDGPFDSALYRAGKVSFTGGHDAELDVPATPERIASFSGHKIEAVACVPGSATGILGTDDENGGGWITSAAFCRP